jgi:protease-4
VSLGFADEVGGLGSAVSMAADEAGLSDYDVTRLESPQAGLLSQLPISAEDGEPASPTTEQVFEYRGVDTVQYLMLHGTIETRTAGTEVTANAST